MKKIILMAAAALVAAAFGWNPIETKVIDSAQAFVDGYATNQVYRMGISGRRLCETNQALAAHVDSLLEKTPPVNFISSTNYVAFPKTRSAAIADVGKTYPACVSGGKLTFEHSNPIDNLAFYLIYTDRVGGSKFLHQRVSKYATIVVSKNLRRHLRAQGKSIVVGPDGKDPCKPYADAVSAAIDAPRYAGLSNALSQCGIDIPVPVLYRAAMDDATLTATTNAVFMGDVKFTDNLQWAIRFALGLEEYNRFVESYNGGSK